MAQKIKEFFYQGDSSDLQELMDLVGGWAQNWDDVHWFLAEVAPHQTKEFTGWDVTALRGYVEWLQREGARFTTDYREMYRELTGRECKACPPPERTRVLQLDLRKMARKWLEGLLFPASKDEVMERAKANHAPASALEALRELDKPNYHNMGALLHHLCERARAHV